jgi:hypothetical protein
MIGMAMAGLSRDPEAPMNAMKSLSMVEDINQKRAELARQEQERAANAGLLRALMAAQQQQGDSISDAYRSFGAYKTAPNQTTQPITQDNLSGTATDLETGQSYNPAQTVPNMDKKALYQAFMDKLATLHKVPPMDLSQFAGASPAMQLAAMKQHLETKPADQLMSMIEKQNKPTIVPEGSSIYTQDPFSGELTQSVHGAGKQSLDKLKAEFINDPTNPKWASLTTEQKRVLGAVSPDKETNMPPAYDMIGTQVLGSAYHTSEGKKQFAELYKNDPRIQQAVTAKLKEEATAKFQGFPPQVVYLQTDKGFVPMPARGAGVGDLPMGKPVEGLGKPMPSDQMTKLSDLDTLQKQIDDTKRLFKPEYVGPVAGRYGSLKEKVVDIPEDQVKFYATVRDMKDSLLRARSGAQINEQEYKRLVSFLPDENLPSGNFAARLTRFNDLINQVSSSKKGEIAAGGYGSPQQPITQVPNKPKFKILKVE